MKHRLGVDICLSAVYQRKEMVTKIGKICLYELRVFGRRLQTAMYPYIYTVWILFTSVIARFWKCQLCGPLEDGNEVDGMMYMRLICAHYAKTGFRDRLNGLEPGDLLLSAVRYAGQIRCLRRVWAMYLIEKTETM
jgi:uncharacterized protein (DUF2126 family)